MSLTQDAVKEITSLSVAASAASALESFNADSKGSTPAIVLPDHYSLKDIEHLQATPNEFRGTYETNNLEEFIDYVIQYANKEESSIFIDADKMSAKAIIDHGTLEQPLWGRHKAVLILEKENEYAELLYKNDKFLKQSEFVFFIEEYKDNIVFIDAEDGIVNFKDGLRSLRSLKLDHINNKTQELENFSVARSALESIEIKSANQPLPAGFIFTCVPYDGLSKVEFVAILRAVVSSNEILLKYKLYQVNAIQKAISEEYKALLSKELTENISIHIGKFSK